MKQAKPTLSKTSVMHYCKLVFRSVLFVLATVLYIIHRVRNSKDPFGSVEKEPVILIFTWLVFVVEIILRFFPSKLESMGCQKQFACNFKEKSKEKVHPHISKSVLLIAILWILLNGIIGALYFAKIIDKGILLLVSLAYSVCDMICILYFCPFQTWFMKNKCCGSCRIYNWDYAMMFTPLIFVPNFFTWSLVVFSTALLIRWEVTAYRHPERFTESTNASLSCANCNEKLCHHKKQLQGFLKRNRHRFRLSDLKKKH